MEWEPIVVEQSFAVPRASLWRAVTDPALMRQWYFEMIEDFKPEVGFETAFDVDTGERVFRHLWKVTAVVPRESITYTWRFEGYPGLGATEWSLSETGEGSRLVLTCTGGETFPQEVPEFRRESGQEGWEYFIQQRLPDFFART